MLKKTYLATAIVFVSLVTGCASKNDQISKSEKKEPDPSSASRPIAQDEKDMLLYINSVGAKPMKWMCQPLIEDMEKFDADFSIWLAQNQEGINRAKQAQIARLKNGETIQEYEIGIQNNINENLKKTTPDRIVKQCVGFIFSVTPKKSD